MLLQSSSLLRSFSDSPPPLAEVEPSESGWPLNHFTLSPASWSFWPASCELRPRACSRKEGTRCSPDLSPTQNLCTGGPAGPGHGHFSSGIGVTGLGAGSYPQLEALRLCAALGMRSLRFRPCLWTELSFLWCRRARLGSVYSLTWWCSSWYFPAVLMLPVRFPFPFPPCPELSLSILQKYETQVSARKSSNAELQSQAQGLSPPHPSVHIEIRTSIFSDTSLKLFSLRKKATGFGLLSAGSSSV